MIVKDLAYCAQQATPSDSVLGVTSQVVLPDSQVPDQPYYKVRQFLGHLWADLTGVNTIGTSAMAATSLVVMRWST